MSNSHDILELTAVRLVIDRDASPAALEEAGAELTELASAAAEDNPALGKSAALWGALLEIAQVAEDDSQCEEILNFARDGLEVFLEAVAGDTMAQDLLAELEQDAVGRWEALPWLLDDFAATDVPTSSGHADEQVRDADDVVAADHEMEADEDDLPSDETADFELDSLDELDEFDDLSELADSADEGEEAPAMVDALQLQQALAEIAGRAETQPAAGRGGVESPDPTLDGELLEAFLDDARRGLAELESAALALESSPHDAQALKQVGRELHTLKGASACVGLNQLAAEIHQAEELLECEQLDVQRLLTTLDEVARKVALVGQPSGGEVDVALAARPIATPATAAPGDGASGRGPAAKASPPGPARQAAERPVTATAPARVSAPVSAPVPATAPAAAPAPAASPAAPAEGTQRIRTSQLDRLMDMLAELVMLRNRRQSGVDGLGQIHGDLHHAAEQLKRLTGKLTQSLDSLPAEAASQLATVGSLAEVAEDLQHSLRGLREFYEPIGRDNDSVTRFIGQFRHELASLRRMPVSSLFQRLRRVARDAARAEHKEVRLEFDGESLGLEPALQERLYEPLLHIIRNAVSHGIESPAQRTAAGKPSAGLVSLNATGGANLVQLEIRDDGRGLDYEAIRRRGAERGLIAADRAVSRQELAQLIFHPGFSTRESVSEMSGRGVGMDVVASTLEQMRGWIDIDSNQGQGTVIRITLPLPSVIQHIMVFRSGGQLFGVPMQSLEFAGQRGKSVPAASLAGLLERGGTADPDGPLLWLQAESAGRHTDKSISVPMLVDEVVGPEEAVIRPLPPLLSRHPWMQGLSLSGNGEVVLLLEPRQLCRQLQTAPPEAAAATVTATEVDRSESVVLVVDDSKTARIRVARPLVAAGMTVLEAGDGAAALRLLEEHDVQAVFTDLEMPVMDGFELLAELKASERWSHLPVVVASTLQHPAQRQRTEALGAAAHLGKPVDDQVVRRLLTELLDQPDSRDQDGLDQQAADWTESPSVVASPSKHVPNAFGHTRQVDPNEPVGSADAEQAGFDKGGFDSSDELVDASDAREFSEASESPVNETPEPAVSEPAVGEPAVGESPISEPAVSEPAVSEPAVCGPTASESKVESNAEQDYSGESIPELPIRSPFGPAVDADPPGPPTNNPFAPPS